MTTSLPNILIVDDIEVNLILLETVLRKESAKIHKATNGPEALNLTEQHEYALIILDVSMPGMNGFELASLIRKQPLNSITPMIFISAIMFDEFSISQGYRSGAVDYLAKPYHHEILLSKVRVFLQLYQQKQDLYHQHIRLQESNLLYYQAQETLKIKLQLEKAVSLASARFSGNFELSSSIQFMLRDIASVCNSSMADFLDIQNAISVTTSDTISPTKSEQTKAKNKIKQLIKAFSDHHNPEMLGSVHNGPWHLPVRNEMQVSIALRVASGERLFGFILLHHCSGLNGWEPGEINSLAVFGTITGNALERNETKKALIKSELRYRSYIENAPEGIVITDTKGNFIEYNKAFAGMFGSTITKGDQINIASMLNLNNISVKFPQFKTLLDGKLAKGEFNIQINGKNKSIYAESVKLPDLQYLIFCTDVTKERQLEKHLIQTERMVGIGEMATGIAHEINQPLNTISFGIDNLFQALHSKTADEKYIKEKSQKIFDSIHRMRSIIDHVRNFARGNDDVILSSFPVSEPINNALSLYTEQLKNHGIIVINELNIQTNNTLIFGNTYKIEQVLLNLFSNARDSMEEKKNKADSSFNPVLHVSTHLAGKFFVIKVADNGMGMTPEQLIHITKPFYTSKAPGKGTGLGLAISQSIVSEHNGTLSFSSIPGEGTSVSVELPVFQKQTSQPVIV